MVMSKNTTGLPLAIASRTMGSAIVTDMVATCGAAAKQLFTMRFRRRRLRRYAAAMACGDLYHVARLRRRHLSKRGDAQRAASSFAGMDAKVKEATTMASTRPQRLQQARTASHKAAAAER